RGAVLQDERPVAAGQGAADALDGDVAGGAFHGAAGAQHLAEAGPLEIAVELLLERHPGEHGVAGVVAERLRRHLHFERSACIHFTNLRLRATRGTTDSQWTELSGVPESHSMPTHLPAGVFATM